MASKRDQFFPSHTHLLSAILFILFFSGNTVSGAGPLRPHLSWDISEAEHCLSPRDPGTFVVKNVLSNIYITQLHFLC